MENNNQKDLIQKILKASKSINQLSRNSANYIIVSPLIANQINGVYERQKLFDKRKKICDEILKDDF